ncbi:MAG: group II intron reverse transcriptase/maturase [Armatimonadota bacterium]
MPNIQEMQRRLSQWATDHPEERYRDLFNLVCDPVWLRQAYENIACNKGARTPGVDGITRHKWEKELDVNIEQLRIELRNGSYHPQPCRRVYIPKRNHKMRPLGIPALRDRVVQEAIRMAMEPIFEADFLPYSHGFRPGRSTQDARAAVRRWMMDGRRMYYVIEGDIKGYFDTIHHKKLMSLLKRRIGDKRLLNTIWSFLKAGVMEDGNLFATTEGTPQGGVISPLLANVYLHELDRYYHRRFKERTRWERYKHRLQGGNNAGYVRYADDFIVTCNGHIDDVRKLKDDISAFLRDELHLTLSEEKTVITHVNDGFTFLGFHFYRGIDRHGLWKPKAEVPDSRIEAVKEKIRELTGRDRVHHDEATIVTQLNRVLRGWGNYYRHVPASQAFRIVDRYAYDRLTRWYKHKYKWSRTGVAIMRLTHDVGNKRLFATWQGKNGTQRIPLCVLTRDVKFVEYRLLHKENPYLQSQ